MATKFRKISWPVNIMAQPLPVEDRSVLDPLLKAVSALHRHLCPRQVLGLRMGLLAGEWLELELPQTNKRLLAIVETDGCFADGVGVATNCWMGRRTLRLEDYGKVAATFVDTQTGKALRLVPQAGVRSRARLVAPDARNRWEAMLFGYQRLPARELFTLQPVKLSQSVEQLISRASARAVCDACGEEILNEREVKLSGRTLCRACAAPAYYTPLADSQ
jgi:formylmethanofuran dehydrogenase subunit E